MIITILYGVSLDFGIGTSTESGAAAAAAAASVGLQNTLPDGL